MLNFQNYNTIIEEQVGKLKYNPYPANLYDPIRYILSLGGKRIRPALVLAGCDLFDKDPSIAVNQALAIEVFHNFTLLHDDIMDNAPLRRGNATVHEKWNNSTAILSGDAMLVKAYELLINCTDHQLRPLIQLFNETALKVCEGQQLDMNFEKEYKISILQYLKMIELKTAVLVGASLKTGAIMASAADEDATAVYEFGKNLGIAFQLQDDILDVFGDAEKFGKMKGNDIVSNKKSYLLVKAYEVANKYTLEELSYWTNIQQFDASQKIEAVTGIYNFLNIKGLAEKEMEKYYKRALDAVAYLPVNAAKKESLIGFAKNLMQRES